MATAPLPESRLNFLINSAHLMQGSSAGTAAYLVMQRNAILFDAGSDLSRETSRQACNACGALFAVGQDTAVKIGNKIVTYECKRCGRTTKQELGPKPPRARRQYASVQTVDRLSGTSRAATGLHTPSEGLSASPQTQRPSDQVKKSAHERKKMRKQGGLQALLANKNARKPQNDFGLDFMDLMKRP